jgi:hypothetical protein
MPAFLARLLAPLAVFALCAAPLAAQRRSPFMDEFRKLMQVHAKDEMAALLKKHEDEAILAAREIAVAMREGTSEELETELDALARAWKKAYDSEFVSLQYDYFALRLTGPYKKQHREAEKRFELKKTELDTAVNAKTSEKYAGLALEFDALGDVFSELGDHYAASNAYWNAAVLSDDGLRGKEADFKAACEAWGLCVAAREEARLGDKRYAQAKVRHGELIAKGYGPPKPVEPAAPGAEPVEPTPAAAPPEPAKPATLGAHFQLVPDIEAIQRPLYTADTNFQIWSAVGLTQIGSSAGFAGMSGPVKVLRTGANKAAVDVDGDGTGDVDVPLTGKITPVEVVLGSGAEQRRWAFLSAIGQQQDTYQGFRFNLGPDTNYLNLYVAPAASLVGTLGGTRVQVIDDNLDGKYGSPPLDWAYMGLVDGAAQHDVDSIVVGESKVARPWSRLVEVGGAWYELEPTESGADFVARPAKVETGTLELDLKGAPVTWLLVRGTGSESDLVFDVANGGADKVAVPAGTYELYSGQVASGKKAQMAKALILPGKNARTWTVTAGETVKVELGAPFTLEFTFGQDAETVTVEGPSIVVAGRGGETYQRLWNCVLSPEVHLRKAGSSRGKKEEELVPVLSQEDLEVHKNDFRAVWFPVGVPIPKPSPGETYEVQLFQKKHKLFGKLESDWKAK